jgi:hypothetical protein
MYLSLRLHISKGTKKVEGMNDSWYKRNIKPKIFCQESIMPHPIVCLDERFRQYLEHWRTLFSRPQFEHFVTVLLALVMRGEAGTLLHLKQAVAGSKSLASLSRFFARAPWDQQQLHVVAWTRFAERLRPEIEQALVTQQEQRPKRPGRPSRPFVTGYLIGDDSTMYKPRGVKMQGLGKHHDTKQEKRVSGHSLVQGLYRVLGQHFPLEPRLYRQQTTCEREEVPFRSKIELMIELIEQFEPLDGTLTHVLLDSWYGAKAIWKAARKRGFLITTALKSNRSIRIADESEAKGWRWQRVTDYAATIPDEGYVKLQWPRNPERWVWVHTVTSSVRSLYRCQFIIIRKSLDDPLSAARFWGSSDLDASVEQLLEHICARWDIEVFFEDMKELFGVDRYQLMSSQGLLRYWSLCWIAFGFLEEQRCVLEKAAGSHVTCGQAKHDLQQQHHRLLLQWIYARAHQGLPCDDLYALFAA